MDQGVLASVDALKIVTAIGNGKFFSTERNNGNVYPNFEQKMVELACKHSEIMALHQQWLWSKGAENITAHTLMVAGRSLVFASLFDFDDSLTQRLCEACLLHDLFKMEEKAIVMKMGPTWDAFEEANVQSTRIITEAGFTGLVVRLANSCGHGSLKEIEAILQKTEKTPEDLACMVIHYVDDYTLGHSPVPATRDLPSGAVDILDQRIDANLLNERYALLNEEGKARFDGETTFEAQRRIGHAVEAEFVERVNSLAGVTDTLQKNFLLPYFIERCLVETKHM